MSVAGFNNILAKRLKARVELSRKELKILAELQHNPLKVRRGQLLLKEGQTDPKVFILQAGWGCSYKLLPNGSRQIISFALAGDLAGIRSVFLRKADHSFSLLTDTTVSVVERAHIMRCVAEFPRLRAALLWAASRDAAMVVEHLASIGRRSALERTAHFFMELAERMRLIKRGTQTEFECPLSQFVLADALGLTPIHVNRTLRQLRELELLTVRNGTVTIHDLDSLRKLARLQVAA
jgi:CRP-like cAMP-binding protein